MESWEERAAVISAWRASGKPALEFATSQGISKSTILWWSRVLRKRAKNAEAAPKLTMARVVRADSRTRTRTLSVAVGHAQILVEQGFDPQLLRDVVRALREAP